MLCSPPLQSREEEKNREDMLLNMAFQPKREVATISSGRGRKYAFSELS